MGRGIYTALAGAVAQGDALDVTANNVANATTTGFRAERVAFREAVSQATSRATAMVVASGGATDERAGTLRMTGGALDVAIDGDAYFGVDTPRGPRYSRAGAFSLDATGTLVTPDGAAVRAQGGGHLQIPTTAASVAIAADGTVSADGEVVGALELTRFDAGALEREGDALFVANAAGTAAGPEVTVASGVLEQANFDLVRGVVDLIKVSRTYEALHRMIDRYKDIDDRTARDIGNPA